MSTQDSSSATTAPESTTEILTAEPSTTTLPVPKQITSEQTAAAQTANQPDPGSRPEPLSNEASHTAELNSAEISTTDMSTSGITATESTVLENTSGDTGLSDTAASFLPSTQQAAETPLAHFEPEQMLEQITGLLNTGGPVVWILSVLSVIALGIVLLKLWQLWTLQAENTLDVEQALDHWQAGQPDQALAALKLKRPISRVVSEAIQGLTRDDQNQQDPLLTQELSRRANLEMENLRALLRPLEVIASLSPLLGLLGTVLGMIVAFQQMEAAGNQVDPSVLSGGIWQALLTTAVGLGVAIPAVAAHTWLERKVERIASAMNNFVTQVFTRQDTKPEIVSQQEIRRAA